MKGDKEEVGKIIGAVDTVCFNCVEDTLNNESICHNCPVRKLSASLNRKNEIARVKQLGETIGYGNLMDIASGLWAIKEGSPMHMPSVEGFLTEEGKEVATHQIEARIEELKGFGY